MNHYYVYFGEKCLIVAADSMVVSSECIQFFKAASEKNIEKILVATASLRAVVVKKEHDKGFGVFPKD